MDKVTNSSGEIIFLDAPGGTGKTYLINLILVEIRRQRQIVFAVASSGIAATLLDGGRTVHSALKLPLDLAHLEALLCDISEVLAWEKC